MRYGPTTNDGEFEAMLRICELCFAPGEHARIREWLGGFDASAFRVVRDDAGEMRACLTRLDMGQYFGGRSVSMTGVAGVGVAPEDRGSGWAQVLMEAFVREAREDGFGLSTLYASTQRLYRKVGYEAAGHCYRYAIPPAMWRVIDAAPSSRGLTLRRGTEADLDGIRACYERAAPLLHGELARGADLWRYMRGRRRRNECVVVQSEGGQIEGYCLYHADPEPDGLSVNSPHTDQIVTVHDLTHTTVRAAVRLVEFLAGFGTLCREVRILGGPTLPILQLLRDNNQRAMLLDHWLVRVLDVKSALEERGYPAGVRAEIALDVTDTMFAENTGRWLLRVADGRGSAEKRDGGGAALKMDERALAALYTGFLSAAELASVGRIEGDDALLGVASAVFAASAPMMTVRF